MAVSSQFLARLGIQAPIIQAPMAGVATPELAAAVSNAGALGSLGIATSTAAQAKQMIEATRAKTTQPFNVNLFCHAPAPRDTQREAAWLAYIAPLFAELGTAPPAALNEIYETFHTNDDMFNMLLEQRPPVVSFHFGLPAPDKLRALKNAGMFTLATATNPQEAALIEQAGIDAIIAQGIEAGGHRGMFDTEAVDERLSTAVLVRQLAQQTALPIIAAGGIMDGSGIKAMLHLGAAAAQMGTAFILCPESAANASYRDSLKSERASRTQLTAALSGRPARGMVNRYIEFCSKVGAPRPAAYPMAYDANKHLSASAAAQGRHEFTAQWAGQGAPLARELPAAELVKALVKEIGL